MAGRMERTLERGLFASRWLMAPFYVGLVAALALLLVGFVRELAGTVIGAADMTYEDAISAALTLLDLSLAANLVLIVIFSGYENFVSRLNVGEHEDRPDWMGTVDFSGLKLKLLASVVVISAIDLLKAFLDIGTGGEDALNERGLFWKVIIHLTFVGSGVLLALMDWIAEKADPATRAAREKAAETVQPGSGPEAP